MRNLKNWLVIVMLLSTSIIFGQTKLTGKIVDETNQPLPGASVVLSGTTSGASSDFDGNFTFETTVSSGTVLVSFVGYETKRLTFNGSTDFGTIALSPSSEALEEIVITATSFAIDRKTPVAVSTISASVIENKLGTQEFPEILKSTPGVYATKSGGGYGDARINLRGFSSENVAVMINGIPINDMENGWVYWSNWAGLADVTSAMQVQRGLGASKVAVPSIGGTINIISKSTDAEKGGNIKMGIGNDGYKKYGMTLSTGIMDNGLAITASAAQISGDGYVNGAQFSGVNYFLNIAKQLNENHKLSFTAIGALQTHGQRYTTKTIAQNRDTEQGGKKFNPDWGYRNGQIENTSYNFYHKPQMSLNHDWTISDKTYITSSLYASFGNGGGRRTDGSGKFTNDDYRLGAADQPINFDRIVQENKDNGALGSTDIFAASRNSHEWYGLLSTLKTDLSDKLILSAGIDTRYYLGKHWYEISDLLGGEYYLNPKKNDNNYNEALKVGDKFNRDYTGDVIKYGTFSQLEYTVNELSVFLSAAISNTQYSKSSFLDDEKNPNGRDSKKANFIGYSAKTGANYNLDDKNNIFANVGYFSKAPFLNGNVFVNKESVDLNENAKNEKVFSAELGYGYRSANFSANVNIYRTSWLDKSISPAIQNPDNVGEYLDVSISGLDALHQGVEFDFRYNASDNLTITGMLSLGDWKWDSDVSGDVNLDSGGLLRTIRVDAKGLKVNDAAQTTYALGLIYKALEKSTIFLDYNYAGDLYAKIDYSRGTTDRLNTWELPSYHLLDLGFNHGFDIGGLDATLSGKMNNIFDVEYISDAFDDGVQHIATGAKVYYGAGRTFSLGLKIKF